MTKNSKLLVCSLAALLFFTTVPLGNFVFAQQSDSEWNETVSGGDMGNGEEDTNQEDSRETDLLPQEDGDGLVDRVTLRQIDGSEVESEVSFLKQYKLRYDLITPLQIKLNATDVCIPPYIEKGIGYLLPKITDDFSVFAGNIEVKAYDDNGDIVTVATVSVNSEGLPIFTVNEDLAMGSLINGYFEIEVTINQDKVGDSENFDFVLPTGEVLHTVVADNKKLPPTVSKEAVGYDPDNSILTWCITVQNAAKSMEDLYPLKFSDIIGEGQTYVEDSFQIIMPTDMEPEQLEVSGNRLSWQCSNTMGNVTIQYIYQTKVDVMELLESNIANDDISVTVINTLSMMGADGDIIGDDIMVSESITENTPVSIVKSGGETIQYDEEEDTAQIMWMVTVTNNGYDMDDLTVYDYFEAGSSFVHLKEEPACDPQPPFGARGYDPSGGINNGRRYQWSYHIGEVSGNAVYTITYVTVIEKYSEYLRKNNGTPPRNKAWFNFTYTLGDDGPPKEFVGDVIDVDAGHISADIIDKVGVYDPAGHRVTWTITVNPNRIELPNASIIDQISNGQKYVSSDVAIPDGVEVIIEEDKEKNTVTFHFGEDGLSGRCAIITLVTELEESESGKWANNWNGSLENIVTLFADGLAQAGVSDTGNALVKSEVIEKELGAFCYTDHTIPVTVTINQNNMELTGAIVTDKLSEYGLTLVKERGVRLDGVLLSEGERTDRPCYSYDGKTLKIYPNETLTHKAVITFTAQATDKYMHDHRSDAVIAFENTAALISDQYGEEVIAQDTVSMQNRPVVKRGTVDNLTGIITYAVEFNRTLTDLPAGLILTDTLPDGLLFKLPTVKLWIADVDGRTGAMTKSGREAAGYETRITASETNTVMQVSLPKGKQAYILEYDVQIADKNKAPFTNRVDVTGYTGDGVKEGSVSFDSVQVAGARLENLIYVKVKKTDTSDNPLAGAVFALKQGEEQLLIGATGENGCLTFAGVAPNTEYTIVELQAPDGYVISPREWRFTTGSKGGEVYAEEKTFVNRVETVDEDPGFGGEEDNVKGEDSGNVGDTGAGKGDRSDGGKSKSSQNNDNNTQLEEDSREPDSAQEIFPWQDEGPELDKLPKTGGFWGSVLMSVIGVILMGISMVMLYVPKKRTRAYGDILLAAGILLIVGTLFFSVYTRWRNAKEVTAFETELSMTDSEKHKAVPCKQVQSLPEDRQKYGAAWEPLEIGEQPIMSQELLGAQADGSATDESVMAVLSIPSISCKDIVKEGSSSRVLAKSLGHVEGTALPGDSGNCVIAGHRNYSFGLHFNRLNEVAVGDEITVTTKEGLYTYTVTEVKVVEPEELSVLNQTEEARLTLITCTPIYIASHRLIIIAELTDSIIR